jgi:flagellar export protein FliJ
MRRYRFRLAPVLRVREIQEDLALGAFTAARSDRQRAEELLAHAAAALGDGAEAGVRTAADVRAVRFEAERRAGDVVRAADQLRSASLAEEHRRNELADAMARVSGLERLRERGRAEHRAELQRDEDLDSDERSMQRRDRAARAARAERARTHTINHASRDAARRLRDESPHPTRKRRP